MAKVKRKSIQNLVVGDTFKFAAAPLKVLSIQPGMFRDTVIMDVQNIKTNGPVFPLSMVKTSLVEMISKV